MTQNWFIWVIWIKLIHMSHTWSVWFIWINLIRKTHTNRFKWKIFLLIHLKCWMQLTSPYCFLYFSSWMSLRCSGPRSMSKRKFIKLKISCIVWIVFLFYIIFINSLKFYLVLSLFIQIKMWQVIKNFLFIIIIL